MTIRTILKMGDPRLLRHAQPVERFDTPELHALVQDLLDTMAPQVMIALSQSRKM